MAISKIVMISDTHDRHRKIKEIPECDLLIHAGDMTGRGELENVLDVYEWLGRQPARHIVTIPGNHEKGMEKRLELYRKEIAMINPGIHVLVDQGVEIEGVKVWGSPATPWFHNWAWNRQRGWQIQSFHWDLIPDDTQILVTHGPPHMVLDEVPGGDRVGCVDLEHTIRTRLKALKLHVFGHIHHSSGMYVRDGVTYVNASICDEMYMASNPPRVLDFTDEFSK
jgi:Icc-related predicted phosphoesterase